MSASATTPPASGGPSATGLEKVAETLHCPLCLDFYKDPVALTCQHNFCRDCIKRVRTRAVGVYHALECPLCRKIMQLSSRDGVDNIPKNFERQAIVETFQAAEREHAQTVRALRESVEVSLTQDLVKQIDKVHQIQEQENEQMVGLGRGERDVFNAAPQPLSDNVFFSQTQTHSGVNPGVREQDTAPSAPFQQEDCSSTPQQQQQRRLHLLQQEQNRLQLKLEQEDVLEARRNGPQQLQEQEWRRQQADRWNELQPQSEAEHQNVKQSSTTSLPSYAQQQPYQYPPILQHSQSLEQEGSALEARRNQPQQPQEPDWRRQQADRWNELQPQSEAEHQNVKQSSTTSLPSYAQQQPYQYPPILQHSQSLEQEGSALEARRNQPQQPHEPDWRRQQADRWNELQPPSEAEHQSVKQSTSSLPSYVEPQPYQYLPSFQHSQSLPYPLMPTSGSYPYPSSDDSQSYGYRSYPYSYPHKENTTTPSPQPSLSLSTKETGCSECHFPASSHCADCLSFFCWQCLQDLHNPTRGLYAGHKVTELTACISPSESGDSCPSFPTHGSSVPPTPIKQDPTVTLNTAMASLNVAGELAVMGVTKQTYKIPYYCGITAMGPGKQITVFGQPAKNCKRFHINFQLGKNIKTGDIALHFNPRFTWPAMVVRNSRMKGGYGSEERGSRSQFPFKVGRPFKLEFICLLDKFEVRVDNQYFISYKHRIRNLSSIETFVIAGDVEISNVLGCA
ncbi:uncharacterized protein [Asterias amurensis]|uniref:uncharacterized protein n=1 Tax=Asterias amurensis TaxID=7602 RepID=UPI003AB2D830